MHKLTNTFKQTANLFLMSILISFCGSSAANETQIALEDWLIERTEQEVALPSGFSLAINNEFGGVRIRTSNDNTASIFAVIQRHMTDVVSPEISISSKEDRIEVSVIYPDTAASEDQPKINENFIQKRRVDISILAPADAPLNINTSHGRAESKGHKGQINIETKTGLINVVTKGSLNAKSESGIILATFQSREWKTSSNPNIA